METLLDCLLEDWSCDTVKEYVVGELANLVGITHPAYSPYFRGVLVFYCRWMNLMHGVFIFLGLFLSFLCLMRSTLSTGWPTFEGSPTTLCLYTRGPWTTQSPEKPKTRLLSVYLSPSPQQRGNMSGCLRISGGGARVSSVCGGAVSSYDVRRAPGIPQWRGDAYGKAHQRGRQLEALPILDWDFRSRP